MIGEVGVLLIATLNRPVMKFLFFFNSNPFPFYLVLGP